MVLEVDNRPEHKTLIEYYAKVGFKFAFSPEDNEDIAINLLVAAPWEIDENYTLRL